MATTNAIRKEHHMRKTLGTILALASVIAVACSGGAAGPSATTGAPAAAATTAAPKPPYKTWAIVYEDGLFGTGAADGLKTALPQQGQTVSISESFKSGSADFTALLNRVKASNAEGLIVVPFAGDIIPLLTQMKEVGYKPKLVYASPPSF